MHYVQGVLKARARNDHGILQNKQSKNTFISTIRRGTDYNMPLRKIEMMLYATQLDT